MIPAAQMWQIDSKLNIWGFWSNSHTKHCKKKKNFTLVFKHLCEVWPGAAPGWVGPTGCDRTSWLQMKMKVNGLSLGAAVIDGLITLVSSLRSVNSHLWFNHRLPEMYNRWSVCQREALCYVTGSSAQESVGGGPSYAEGPHLLLPPLGMT